MSSRFGFVLVILALIFDYARPQDIVPAIGALRPTWILIPLMVIAWVKSARLRTAVSPQMTLMLCTLALLLVHIPLAMNHYWAYETAQDFFLCLPVCVSVILFVDTPERLLSFTRWWVLLALYIAVKTILGKGTAGSSFLGDPNDVSLLLNVMLPFVLCMFVYEQRTLLKVTYLGISLVCVAGIVTTASRGGFVGLLAVMSVIWLMSPRKVLALVLVSLLAISTYELAPSQYWNRMSTIESTNEGTAKGRLDSWQAAWSMFKDHPLGVGGGNFPVRFPEYQPRSFTHNMWGRAAHSLWFTLLSELGVPGAILYALLFRANWRSLWRLHHLERDQHPFAYLLSIAFLASLAGFFASGTFISVLYYPHYWYLSAMIVASERSLAPILPGPGAPAVASGQAAGTTAVSASPY